MDREPVPGECVVIARNSGDHPGHVGDQFIVSDIDDSDDTLRGIPRGSTAAADFWIPWSDVEPVAFGWHYAQGHLPPDLVELLGICEGIDHVTLNRQIKDLVFDSLPDWRERVTEALRSLDPANG